MYKTISRQRHPAAATCAARSPPARRAVPAARHCFSGTQCANPRIMMNTVWDTFSSIGDRGGDIARNVGQGTAHLARRVGGGTVDLARDIGPRRALIGLAIAAVAIGGSIAVMRYLRARCERDRQDLERDDYVVGGRIIPSSDPLSGTGVRSPL